MQCVLRFLLSALVALACACAYTYVCIRCLLCGHQQAALWLIGDELWQLAVASRLASAVL